MVLYVAIKTNRSMCPNFRYLSLIDNPTPLVWGYRHIMLKLVVYVTVIVDISGNCLNSTRGSKIDDNCTQIFAVRGGAKRF